MLKINDNEQVERQTENNILVRILDVGSNQRTSYEVGIKFGYVSFCITFVVLNNYT